jgi:hypothetical protein
MWALSLLIIFSLSREIREQSLSRRDEFDGLSPLDLFLLTSDGPSPRPPPSYRPPGQPSPYYRPQAPSNKISAVSKPPAGKSFKKYALIAMGVAAVSAIGISLYKGMAGDGSSSNSGAPPPSSTPSPSSASFTNSNPTTITQINGQDQNQRRAVDHGKRVDFFGEPHLSHGL